MSLCTIYYVLCLLRGKAMSILCTMSTTRQGLVMSLCTRQGLVMSLCTRQETVGEAFAPLGPPLLPWENRMGWGQTDGHRDSMIESAQWADSMKMCLALSKLLFKGQCKPLKIII